MSYKKRPELLDVLRRRGVTFEQWCTEFGVTNYSELVQECARQDVQHPSREHELLIPSVKAELGDLLDEVHTTDEKIIPISQDDVRLVPQTCTRGIHDGPCNGFPAPDCQVYDDETKGTMRCADFEAKVGMKFEDWLAERDAKATKPTKRSKPVKFPKELQGVTRARDEKKSEDE